MWGFSSRNRLANLEHAVKVIAVIEEHGADFVVCFVFIWLYLLYFDKPHEIQKEMQMEFCANFLFLLPSDTCTNNLVLVDCVFVVIAIMSIFYIHRCRNLYLAAKEKWSGKCSAWLWCAKTILIVLLVTFGVLVTWIGVGSAQNLFCWILLILYRLITYAVVKAYKYEVLVPLFDAATASILPPTYVDLEILILKVRLIRLWRQLKPFGVQRLTCIVLRLAIRCFIRLIQTVVFGFVVIQVNLILPVIHRPLRWPRKITTLACDIEL